MPDEPLQPEDYLDADIEDADWPKRTPDMLADLEDAASKETDEDGDEPSPLE